MRVNSGSSTAIHFSFLSLLTASVFMTRRTTKWKERESNYGKGGHINSDAGNWTAAVGLWKGNWSRAINSTFSFFHDIYVVSQRRKERKEGGKKEREGPEKKGEGTGNGEKGTEREGKWWSSSKGRRSLWRNKHKLTMVVWVISDDHMTRDWLCTCNVCLCFHNTTHQSGATG